MEILKELQDKIGYKFNNEGLLRQAITHSSYTNEKKMKKTASNERLEFLGDAVLELISSEFLFERKREMSEGELTRIRASLVCGEALVMDSKVFNLGDYLLLGNGEEQTGGRERKTNLEDATEAIIGAIYLDGGLSPAKEFVEKFILNDYENKMFFKDSKSILMEKVQAHPENGELNYEVISEDGPAHKKHFVVAAYIGGKKVSEGEGFSKKEAEQQAAYKALIGDSKEIN